MVPVDIGTVGEPNEAPNKNLRAIWGAGEDHIWVAGDDGVMFFYDGTGWTSQESHTSATIEGIWGTGADNVYAVGHSGSLVYWNGTDWTYQKISEGNLYAISGNAADDIWAVGAKAQTSAGSPIFHFDGTSWVNLTDLDLSTTLHGVVATGPNSAFAVGDDHTIVILNDVDCSADETCHSQQSGNSTVYWAVDSGSSGIVYFAGEANKIGRYDERDISFESSGRDFVVRALEVDGNGNLVVAGLYGNFAVKIARDAAWYHFGGGMDSNVIAIEGRDDILYASVGKDLFVFDGSSWSLQGLEAPAFINALAVGKGDELWAVGDSGLVFRCSGIPVVCSRESTGMSGRLFGVAYSEADDTVWAVGEHSTVLLKKDDQWQQVDSAGIASNLTLLDVWVSDTGGVWVVGKSGGMYRWNGSSFDKLDAQVGNQTIEAVWGSSDDDVWAVGSNGTVIHYTNDGNIQKTSTVLASPPTTDYLESVWGTSTDDVWIGGQNGTLIHWDGTELKQVRSGTANSINAVWCKPQRSAPTCWLGGNRGTILGSEW